MPVHFAEDEPQQTLGPAVLKETSHAASAKNLGQGLYMLPQMNTRIAPVFNQGSLGSCVANALVAAFDQIDSSPVGSRLFCQQNARTIAGTVSRDTGTTIWAGIQSLIQHGLCFESTWPYQISNFAKRPPPQAQTQAKTNKVIVAKKVPLSEDGSSLKEYILAGFPVVVGICVQTSFVSAQVAKTGVVELPQKNEKFLGGHAVLVVGFDDTAQRFWVRNSWGTSWGLSGLFTLPQQYLANSKHLASDFWVITKTI